jgi:hypothetical protein
MAEADETRADSPAAGPEPFRARLRRAGIAVLFAAILLVPKLLHVRRDPRAWFAFRIALGLLGAALVVVPLGLWSSWLAAVLGLVLFMTAVLLAPAAPTTTLNDKAQELGALVVVNGGIYAQALGAPAAAHLFVGAENIWVLDSSLHLQVEIPLGPISSLRALPLSPDWALRIEWPGQVAEFLYTGFFAEHLARVGESTIRSVMQPSLPVIQPAPAPEAATRGRAAGAGSP